MSLSYSEYKYYSLEPGNSESGRRLADFLIRLVEGIEGVKSICDLGCGNGYLAGRLAERGYIVSGVDASESGINLARAHYRSDNLEFICAEINPSVVEKVSRLQFDLVISSDVIEHLYCPGDLIEAAFNLLKPNGKLLIGAPYHGYLKNLFLSLFNKWDSHHGVDWDGGHIKFFAVKTLRSMVESHGFAVVKFYYCGRMAWLWKNMVCFARRR